MDADLTVVLSEDLTVVVSDDLTITVEAIVETQGGGGVTDHGALTGLGDDDHPQYHNNARGDVRYAGLGHNHDATYAPAAKGVTNGDAHDHSGGDGAQISYSGLSDKPTLGTASTLNVPSSGDAAVGEVVKGNDSRLADARPPVAHIHDYASLTGKPTIPAASSVEPGAVSSSTSGTAGTSPDFARADHSHDFTGTAGTDPALLQRVLDLEINAVLRDFRDSVEAARVGLVHAWLDEFPDVTGVDLALSSGWEHNATGGWIGPVQGATGQTASIAWGNEANYSQEDVRGSFAFTVDTANVSGHFSADVSSSKIKPGCRMSLGGNIVTITGISGAGTAANSVTFTGTAPTQTATTPDWIRGTSFGSGKHLLGAGIATKNETSPSAYNSWGSSAGWSWISRDWSVNNGVTVTKLGIRPGGAISGTLYLVERTGAGQYSVRASVAFTHSGGSAIEYFALGTPYAVPATGDFYVGVYTSVAIPYGISGGVPRATYNGQLPASIGGLTEDASSNTAWLGVEYQSPDAPTSAYYTTITGADQINTAAWSDVNSVTVTETLPPSTSLVSRTAGTAIGNMTDYGGLAVAYDGTNHHSQGSCSGKVAVSGYNNHNGKDWGSGVTKVIGRVVIYGPTDANILNTATTTLKIQGSNDGANFYDISNVISVPQATYTVVNVNLADFTSFTAYRYHRVNINGNGTNAVAVGEIEWHEVAYPAAAYYSVSFDNRQTFKAFTGGAWRAIASNLNSVHGGTNGVWYYRDNANAWTAASVNAAANAISQAVAAGVNNKLSGTALGAISDAEWNASGGWAAGTLDVAATLYTASAANNPQVDAVTVNFDTVGQDAVIVFAPFGVSAAPASSRAILAVEPVDAVTLGVDLKAWALKDDGLDWVELPLVEAGTVSGAVKLVAAEAAFGAGGAADYATRLKLTTHNTKRLKLHAAAHLLAVAA